MRVVDSLTRLRAADTFFLDMDGTLYVDEVLLPGTQDLLAAIARRGGRRLFLTNNSSARGEDYRQRLERLGIPAQRMEILTSGDATIHYILGKTPYRSAYVVGTPALLADFASAGIDIERADPECLVVGFDRTLTYAKLERATRMLFAGKPYYATHPDKTCITHDGLIPDVAAIIAALAAVTGRQPDVIVGKPYPEIVANALQRLGGSPERAVMIGDQLDTDMTLARTSGILGALVLSGETSPARLAAWPVEHRPPLVASSVAEIADWLRA